MLASGGEAICWPLFPSCWRWRVFDRGAWQALLVLRGALACVTAIAFLKRRGAILLALLEVLRWFVVLQDYRLRMNQHYMATAAAIVLLALPGKRRALQVL